MLGRWNDDLRENERTQHLYNSRNHPEKSVKQENWNSLQREIPYAWRFDKPLQRRLQVYGGQPQDPEKDTNFKDLRGLFPKEKCSKVCDDCKKGVKSILGEINPEDMAELNRLVYRVNHKQDDKVKQFLVDSDVFDIETPQLIGSHELCPYLEAGACLWFPEPDTSKLHEIKIRSSTTLQAWHVRVYSLQNLPKRKAMRILNLESPRRFSGHPREKCLM